MEQNSNVTERSVPNAPDDHRPPPMNIHFFQRVTYVT